tara:strand:- start:33 stop:149 length:117 start_codon:yes stop_codon:yes gene_type:complete
MAVDSDVLDFVPYLGEASEPTQFFDEFLLFVCDYVCIQ